MLRRTIQTASFDTESTRTPFCEPRSALPLPALTTDAPQKSVEYIRRMPSESSAMASVSIIGPDERVYLLHKVACLARYLRRHAIATESLLEGSGIPTSSLHDARSRVSRRQLFATFRNFIRLAPSDHSALDAGAAFHISN